ncbi:methyltransferase domain-containing protein [bacterium]|nr:methyltransferase domain-containing protein [bacterium]
MSIYDILACPNCRIRVEKHPDHLHCTNCHTTFPIINNTPIMFPDGKIPQYKHHEDLSTRKGYDPWIPRLIMQSLLDNHIVLDVGAGNMLLDDPCVIRMDITLTPYVDIVTDLHALPFLPGSIDFIFSLAVVEHLKNPFRAAESIYSTLKDGGYIYHECNFIWPYHGFPHHYFNATMQGLESVFEKFTTLRQGVAPYQMPSFALGSIIDIFLQQSTASDYAHGRSLTKLLEKIQKKHLQSFDIYFSEDNALNLAAGVYFSGLKESTPEASIIPDVIVDIWKKSSDLQNHFPNIKNLTTVKNILVWAMNDGRSNFPEIDLYLNQIKPFNKNGDEAVFNRGFKNEPLAEPYFGAIGSVPDEPMSIKHAKAIAMDFNLAQKAIYILKHQGLRMLFRRIKLYLAEKFRKLRSPKANVF